MNEAPPASLLNLPEKRGISRTRATTNNVTFIQTAASFASTEMCWRSSTTNTHLEENWLMANNGKWHSHNILVSVSLGSPFVDCCLKGPVEAQSDQLLKVVAKSRETPPYCVICAQLCLLALSQKDTASADVTQEANHLMVLEAEAQSSVTFLLWTRGV